MAKKNSSAKSSKSAQIAGPTDPVGPRLRLYTLQVFLPTGYLDEEGRHRNRKISRKIQIRGDQTLADLHEIIFVAFDRFDEHLYEFQMSEKKSDRTAKRYRRYLPPDDFAFDEVEFAIAEETTLNSLQLKADQLFQYVFDFGDNWEHQIKVVAVEDVHLEGEYPRIIEKKGDSPPQYPDMEEMD